MLRARHGRFARLGPLVLAPIVALLAVGLTRASEPAAVPAWPVSAALLVGEVLTGGATASDEFIELYNASSTSASLANLEVVYVTATGGTVTRKANWGDDAVLAPRHHVLLGNSAGSYATAADLTYSGGLAASGGVILLRVIGGQPLDAVAWGDAANDYLEGSAAPAPAAGSSVERRPGGTGGNWLDTNDNAADTLTQPAPVAQNLLAPPAPEPTAAPTTGATGTLPALASATPTAIATPIAIATPSAIATPTATPTAIATISISRARTRTGQNVTVQGITTVPVGLLDADGRRVTIEDSSGGILVRLPTSGARPRPGDRLRVSGTVGTYYGAPQIGATAAVITAHGRAITPLVVRSGPILERLEWRLVRVSGTIRSVERDGKAWRLDVALTSGAVPVHGETRAAIPSTKLNKGARVTVTGIVRRPRTTAADRRFALIPRGTADVLIATAGTRGGSARSATANGTATRGSNGAGSDSVPPAGGSDVVDVDLARLGAYEGQLVRVGGLLVARAGVRLTLRDASGSADARLPASASALVSELVPGEALNVTGQVRKAGQARWEVVAETPGDIARVGSLEVLGSVTSRPNQSATAAAGAPTRYPGAPAAAAPDRWLGPGPLGTAGLVPPALLLLGVASAGLWAVGLYFRRRVPPDGPGGS